MSQTPAEADTRWVARPAAELLLSRLDDTYVAYHRPSGKTHFFNVVTAELLENVLVVPRTARDAAEQLAAREGAVADAQFISVVAESLSQLEYLGLIEHRDA